MIKFTTEYGVPIGNGGGIIKTVSDLEKILLTEVGAVEIGSITEVERPGNEGNTFRTGNGFTLNSIGLKNPGLRYYKKNLKLMITMIREAKKKSIVNVAGFSAEEYSTLTRLAFDAGSDFVVLNFGCPNVASKQILSYDRSALRSNIIYVLGENIEEAKDGRIGIKLSPIFNSPDMDDIASFLNLIHKGSHGYIGFVTTQNTVPNCYDEDDDGTPYITPNNGLAGMAGKAIFPMALAQVRQWRKLLDQSIKIIGVGGVTTGADMLKMMRYADFVQVTSAYYINEDLGIFSTIGGEYLYLKSKKPQ